MTRVIKIEKTGGPEVLKIENIKIGSKTHDRLKNSTLICLKNGSDLKISSVKKSQFLIIAGKPIGEPIARGGPFVMNTKQEILKAVQDYHSGNFVQK